MAECEVDPALDGVLDAVLHHQGRDFFQQRRYAEAEESLGRATRLRLERGAEGLAGVAVEALRRARAARRAERRATRFRRYGLAPTALAVAALVYGLVVLSAPPGAVGEALFGVVVATVVVGGWSGGVCWAYTTPRTRSWGSRPRPVSWWLGRRCSSPGRCWRGCWGAGRCSRSAR